MRAFAFRLVLCLSLGTAAGVFGQESNNSLERPKWQVGDRWVIETVTDRIQGREGQAAVAPPKLRWSFQVAKLEKVAGHECYRIDIECLSKGRLRPQTSIWCDKETLFLRQFQTQLAFQGRYRTIHESYDCPDGQFSPVLTPMNAIPISLPAFVPAGSKSVGSYSYTSQPLPAGSKDPTIIRFSHQMTQDISSPNAKSLGQLPRSYSKNLDAGLTEVKFADKSQSVVQVWKKGNPWPLFVDHGRTKAWLVPEKP